MRIVFMGTPDIAATCLYKLIEAKREVVGVVTGEDKARGRGNVLTPTPVKSLALANGIPVYTPKTLRDEAFMEILRELMPDIIVVVAYGKILPKEVLFFPQYGSVNVHVSLLPKYRGAAPMQRAIMDGEKETGVTIMYMDEGLDTGDIILTERFPIGKKDNFETIHDKSAEIGGNLMLDALLAIENGTATREKQNDAAATYAKKIEKSEAKIDLSKSAAELDAVIRGLTPIPGAYVMQNGKMLKIAEAEDTSGKGEVGEVIAIDDKGVGSFTVACGEGALKILRIKPEGKGVMTSGDYIRGRKISKGDILN
jgi:methionyl-tRNA formyltransferase